MLFTFGDSFTWGTALASRDTQNWPAVLSRLLDTPLQNNARPGGNNWYIARKINQLSIERNDVVVIGWTNPDRFELPVSDPSIMQERNGRPSEMPDVLDNIPVRRFYPGLPSGSAQVQKLNDTIYTYFYNEDWFYEHFKICVQSVRWRLKQIGCKYLMFYPWVWWPANYTREYEMYDRDFVDWPNSPEAQTRSYIENDGHYDARTHEIIAHWLHDRLK